MLVSVGTKRVEVGRTGVLVKTVVIVGVAKRLSATKLSGDNCCQAYAAPPIKPTTNTIDSPIRHVLDTDFSFKDRPVLSLMFSFLFIRI